MPVEWSMKERQKNGSWQPVALAELAGRTLRQALEWMHGREIVAEFKIGQGLYYFCGTDHWKQRMNKKGKAVLAAEATELLAASNPELLDQLCPGPLTDQCNMVEQEFGPGCGLVKMEMQEKLLP